MQYHDVLSRMFVVMRSMHPIGDDSVKVSYLLNGIEAASDNLKTSNGCSCPPTGFLWRPRSGTDCIRAFELESALGWGRSLVRAGSGSMSSHICLTLRATSWEFWFWPPRNSHHLSCAGSKDQQKYIILARIILAPSDQQCLPITIIPSLQFHRKSVQQRLRYKVCSLLYTGISQTLSVSSTSVFSPVVHSVSRRTA